MASLSPLPKENLLHCECDMVGSLDIFTRWFLCSLCVLLFATRVW